MWVVHLYFINFFTLAASFNVWECVHTCTGEVIGESTEDADDSGYHAETDDVVSSDHVAAVSTRGKAEVQFLFYSVKGINS